VELFNRSEPQPTVVLVQPQSGGLTYATTAQALRWQGTPALPPEASAPALLPRQAIFPRELGADEVAALVQASDDDSRLVVLLLLSGASLDEALALHDGDVDLAGRLIHVRGGSVRDIALGEPLRALLAARTAARPAEMLLGHPDRPATRDTVRAQILCAAHDAGIEDAIDVTADGLRHTYVAFLVRQGIRFADLTRLVGHLPAEVLGAYSALSPPGSRISGEAINVVFPVMSPRESE
jgi:succinoglycan biosynthesis transport protein ExoP